MAVARPSMGAEARTVQGGLKISKQEEALLIETHGSVGKGLRAALDRHVKAVLSIKSPTRDVSKGFGVTDAQIADDITRTLIPREHQGHPMLDDDIALTQALAHDLGVPVPGAGAENLARGQRAAARAFEVKTGDDPTIPDRPLHRHRRGVLKATEFQNGTKVQVFACSEAGCEAELR